jgi:hypothetical protein
MGIAQTIVNDDAFARRQGVSSEGVDVVAYDPAKVYPLLRSWLPDRGTIDWDSRAGSLVEQTLRIGIHYRAASRYMVSMSRNVFTLLRGVNFRGDLAVATFHDD